MISMNREKRLFFLETKQPLRRAVVAVVLVNVVFPTARLGSIL